MAGSTGGWPERVYGWVWCGQVPKYPFRLLFFFYRVSLGQRLEKVKGHKEAEHSTSLGSKEHTFTIHKVRLGGLHSVSWRDKGPRM